MRHHEDRVDGELGHALRLERVNHHHHRLRAARRVREHAARADDEIELHQIDERFGGALLAERVRDGPLLLHAAQPDGELLVLLEREPERLARDRLLDLELLARLGNRRRADHLVADAVAQIGRVEMERHPAQDRRQPRLEQHVRDRVAHAEVGADGAIENAAKDREHVGGGPADVDADDRAPGLGGHGLDHQAHRGRRRHDRRVGPLHELRVAGRLRHHVLHEEVVDALARRPEVLALEHRPQVLDGLQRDDAPQDARDLALRRGVARVDHRQFVAEAEARLGLRGA